MRFFSSDVAPLGFIGLGNMGGPMARNLLKAGHKVVGFDVSPANLDSFAAAGGQPVESPLAVAALAKTVVTMLPAGSHVLEVYNGQDGLLSDGGAGNGSLLIDCSTCEPAIGKQVAALAGQRGAATVDAPVSGGTPAAEQASLTFMVGGPEVAVKQAELILQHMGKKAAGDPLRGCWNGSGCEAVQQPGAGYHHGGRLRGPRASRAFWFGPEEAGGDSEYQLWQVLEQRAVQPLPWSYGRSACSAWLHRWLCLRPDCEGPWTGGQRRAGLQAQVGSSHGRSCLANVLADECSW